jgi:hypothetical protein
MRKRWNATARAANAPASTPPVSRFAEPTVSPAPVPGSGSLLASSSLLGGAQPSGDDVAAGEVGADVVGGPVDQDQVRLGQ